MSRYTYTVTALLLAGAASAQVTLNPTGGTGAGTGIRITAGNSGQLQVRRNGTGQFYSPTVNPGATTAVGVSTGLSNGVYLAVGNTVFGPQHFAFEALTDAGVVASEFTAVSNSVTPQPDGSGTATTVLRGVVGGRNYDVTVRYDYSFPNDFVTVTHTVTVPAGNTQLVKLYHALDAYLGGNDFGPSFYSPGAPTIVGAYRPAANIVEAWRYRTGLAWTGYYAGFYECMFRSALCPGIQNNSIGAANAFNNYVQSTEADNGFGIMWNVGLMPGTFSSTNDLTFFSFQPQLRLAFGTTAMNANSTTTLTFTIDNVPGALPQAGMAFSNTLPTGLTLSTSAVTNTCGGMITNAAGTALNAGSTSLRLSAGSMAAGVTRCTVVATVTASVPGAYVDGPSNLSSLSVLESQVAPQTLSVILGAPVVTLATPGVVNSSNQGSYGVTGTCQDSNGTVTITVGTLTTTASCAGGAFSATVNATSLADTSSLSVRAQQTNLAGTGTDTKTTRKDTVAPAAPVLTTPSPFSNSATPQLSGTAEAGTTVRVFDGPVEVCTAVATMGTWSCVSAPLPEGLQSITVTATDPAGNTSVPSAPKTFTVDTVVPVAPTISSPGASAVVGLNPSISGNAEPNAQVTVTNTMTSGVICTATANTSGLWSCATNLSAGSYSVTARQADRANNTSAASPVRPFSVANVPSVSLNTPAPISTANVSSYPVSGTCSASSGSVSVSVGVVSGTSTCTSGGTFSTTLNVSSLADAAAVVVTAQQTNASGTGTDTRNTPKDTRAPGVPSITLPTDGSFTSSTTPTFTGTADPGTLVRVMRGMTELCSATALASGQWSCVSSSLSPGSVTVVARGVDAVGNTSADSASRSFTVDTDAPTAPAITAPADMAQVAAAPTISGTAEPLATVSVFEGAALVCTVTADSTGSWSCPSSLGAGTHVVAALQRDRAGNTGPLSVSRTILVVGPPTVTLATPGIINSMNASSYVVTGACTTSAGNVSVTVGAAMTSAPCTNATFTGTLDVSAVPDSTNVQVRATQTNPSGMGTDTRTATKDTVAPGVPTFSTPMDAAITNSNTPAFSGTAEPGSTVQVTVGGTTVCQTVTPQSGVWSCVSTRLMDGQLTAIATATDAAGNPSLPSGGRTFTIDTMVPIAPVITSPAQSMTVGLSPVLSGTAEPASTVRVFEGGSLVCETTTSTNGQWMCQSMLNPGMHTVTATQTDRAGNVGPSSAARGFTVENIPTVVIDTPAPINAARASAYRVSGFCTTQAGIVTVKVDNATATAPCLNGSFTAVVNTTLVSDGPAVSITATQTTAGGTGRDMKTAVKDTVAPRAPVVNTPADGVTTTSNRPVVSGSAEPNSTVTVVVSGMTVGSTVADANGNWSFMLPTPLAEGVYTVTASATDTVGNPGPASMSKRFGVDSVAPNPPVITSPEDKSEHDQDRPIQVVGTAEAGALVTLYLDGVVQGTTQAGPDGRFTFTIPAGKLQAEDHVVAAEATDTAGNTSQRSNNVRFTVVSVNARFAGQGLIGCSSAGLDGAVPLLMGALALLFRRRRSN